MKNHLLGNYYPHCDSEHTFYSSRRSVEGEIYVRDGNLVFERKIMLLISSKSHNLSIPLSEIALVERCRLNGFLPFGVCIYIKDGTEYMLGHVNNKKLERFIVQAMAREIEDYSATDQRRVKAARAVWASLAAAAMLAAVCAVIWLNNLNTLDRETDKIGSYIESGRDIDQNVYCFGKLGQVERAVKNYYVDYFAARDTYTQNCASVLYDYAMEVLEQNGSAVVHGLMDELTYREELGVSAMEDMIALQYRDTAANYIVPYNLPSFFDELYFDRALIDAQEAAAMWSGELELYGVRMEKIYAMLELLFANEGAWYLENGELYLDDAVYDRYTALYGEYYATFEETDSI